MAGTSAGNPSRWVRFGWAAVVVLAGLAASFALWDPLEIDEKAHVRRLTAQTAASIKSDLEADVEVRLLAQVRLAELEGWEEHPGELLDTLEWTLNCQLFLEHYPSYLNLQWLDPEGRVRWTLDRGGQPVNLRAGATGAVPTAFPAAVGLEGGRPSPASPGNRVSVSRAFVLPNGRLGIRVVAPVVRQGVPIGSLVSVWDPRTAVAAMVSDHSNLGYAVAVNEGALEIFRTPGASAATDDEWAQQVDLALPGTTWQIRIWPDANLLSELRSSLPELAGALGGLLGSALLLSWHFATTARSTSRELSRARDELDLRVSQRTAELTLANERLGGQVAERVRAEDSLRRLSGRLLQLQDEERRRIARELHDSTTQMLGALAISLAQADQLAQRTRNQDLKSHLRESAQHLERVTADIRTISHLLHPPVLDELGLEYVLPWYVDAFSRRSGIAVELQVPPNLGRLAPEVELALFRITQEALTNVHRHSGSPTARIALTRTAESAQLRIEDRGCGVPPDILEPTAMGIAKLGVGITGMRERVRQLGGALTIAATGDGTAIEAVLPLH